MQRLFDIKKTQLQMVADRGYDISDEKVLLDMDIEEFSNYVNELMKGTSDSSPRSLLSRFYTMKLLAGGIRIMLVSFKGKSNSQQKQVPAEVTREFIMTIQRYGVSEAILIVDSPLSPTGEKELSALTLTRWQIFFDYELAYNPTIHVDCPKHERLSPEEAQDKLRELRVDLSKLLLMKVDDPVARYYGWNIGDLIRVRRHDDSINILGVNSINYRVVVG